MNFEAVYQNAEVVVEGNTKKVTLELLALHPDTLLTWPKFCEMLASMRGDGDGGTAVRLPHQWRAKTHGLLDISEAVVMASKILLAQGLEVMKGVDETKRATNLVVQKSLRRKIRESLDCRTIAERRLQEVDVELKQLEWAEKSLEAAFEKKAKPLAVSQVPCHTPAATCAHTTPLVHPLSGLSCTQPPCRWSLCGGDAWAHGFEGPRADLGEWGTTGAIQHPAQSTQRRGGAR